MVRIEIAYRGDLRCSAVHAPSGSLLETDAPVDNCGKGQRFSPTDLVATALGTCLATVMGIVAQRDGISLEGLTITVDKEMAADPLRRIGRLTVRVALPAGLTEAQRRKLQATALTCPVRQSLHPEVALDLTFHCPDAAALGSVG